MTLGKGHPWTWEAIDSLENLRNAKGIESMIARQTPLYLSILGSRYVQCLPLGFEALSMAVGYISHQ